MKFADFKAMTGDDLDKLGDELSGRSREYLTCPLSELEMNDRGQVVHNNFALTPTSLAAQRLGGKLGIPASYVVTAPTEIIAYNMNQFLPTARGNVQLAIENGNKLVGVLPASARAVPADMLIDELSKQPKLDLARWYLTERGIQIRFMSQSISVQPRVGDIVKAGVDVTDFWNDQGGLGVMGCLHRLSCTNGATVPAVTFASQLRREAWREPAALIMAATGYFNEAIRAVGSFAEGLKELTTKDLLLPVDGEGRDHVLRPTLRAVGLPSRYVESVATALPEEEPTLFGFYNAVTRLGRDAGASEQRPLFERAGFHTVVRREAVAAAFADAVETL